MQRLDTRARFSLLAALLAGGLAGSALAQPANDNCSTAEVITSMGRKAYTFVGATDSVLTSITCGTAAAQVMSRDVWFRWTALDTGQLALISSTLPAPTANRIAVYAAATCPGAGASPVGCAASVNTLTVPVTAGQTYFIQVAATTAAASALPGNIDIDFVPSTTGACCTGSSCRTTGAGACAASSGTFLGAGSVCNPSPGPATAYSGAGFALGSSASTTGNYSGTLNVPDNIVIGDLSLELNIQHTWAADLIIRLSKGDRTVSIVHRAGRGRTGSGVGPGSDIGAGTTAPTTAPAIYTFRDTATATWWTATTPTAPAVIGAGDYQPSTLSDLRTSLRAAFNGVSAQGDWTLNIDDEAAGDFGNLAGWRLLVVAAGPSNCAVAGAGRCCVGARCVLNVADTAACTALRTGSAAGSSFTAGAALCNATGVFNTPCCQADYNKLGGIGVQDIFDFLTDWFSSNTNADINGGGVGVQDVFDFISAWFAAGCS